MLNVNLGELTLAFFLSTESCNYLFGMQLSGNDSVLICWGFILRSNELRVDSKVDYGTILLPNQVALAFLELSNIDR